MNTKSLAKSKRAHSQHHSKKHHHHPNQTLKGPSTSSIGASSSKKPTPGKEIKEKPSQSQVSSALPSNWDRYEEEFDLGTDDSSQDRTNQPSDVVLPKSKGADYAYLISEAKSQYQTSSSSEIFPSFDDVVNDFDQGMGTFLSVRGQSILSWIEGDSFIVDDKATTSNEASFLSLDLHALAEQLAKVDLSKRLFIEADLLPPEQCREELHASYNLSQDTATCGREASKRDSDELQVHILSDVSSETTVSNHLVQDFSNDRLKSTYQVKDETLQFGRTESESSAQLNATSNPNKKPSEFEAAAAEAELDMLLGSFSEANFLESPGFTEVSRYMSREGKFSESIGGSPLDESMQVFPAKKGPDLCRSALAADLDDTLDDLLKETSSLISQSAASLSLEVKATPSDFLSSPSSRPTSKPKVLDDFDSWLDTI